MPALLAQPESPFLSSDTAADASADGGDSSVSWLLAIFALLVALIVSGFLVAAKLRVFYKRRLKKRRGGWYT
jgi:hypothetical protein